MSVTTKESIPLGELPTSKKDNSKSSCSILKYITIIHWLPKYSRLDAVSDLVAGFSLGLTLIPQSIAYATLAGLTAQYGLYSCLMGNFVYIFLGTIKEVSIGPSSLMSLLTFEYTRNMPVDFVVLFCFLAGCVELLMGLLRLGSYRQNNFQNNVQPLQESNCFDDTRECSQMRKEWNDGSLKHCAKEHLGVQIIIRVVYLSLLELLSSLSEKFGAAKFLRRADQTKQPINFRKFSIVENIELSTAGFLVDFISVPVTSGFTSATSIIIIISQLQGLLGLKFKAHSIVDNLSKIFQNVQNVRIPDFLLGICSIAFLLFFRQLKDIDCCFGKDDDRSKEKRKKTWLKKFLWFLSICRNALVILIASTIAYYFEKTGSSPFILSGKIQSGLPKLSVPSFSSQVGNETYTFLDMCSHLGSGIIVLPLVSVLANVAIAKAFASGSSVNATQEMLTLGLCNIFGSFVSSMPAAGAFTRSAVVSASGVRTPMAGIYVGMMTLLALSFLTPYFYYIPRSTLAAVLISAVIFIIDLKIIRLLWKGCKRDAVAAIVTFLVSVIFGVELGLLVGALFSLIFFLRSPARPKIEVIQCKTQLGNKYIVLKPDTGLFYPAANYFCNKVMKIIHKYDENNVPFIINCERMRSIDYTAIKGIEIISANVNAEKKRLWFMNVSLRTFNNFEAFANSKHFHFIDEEDKISSIFHDGFLINSADEVKEQLLENMIGNATFTCANDNKKGAETLPKLATNSGDDGEEVTLMLTPSPKQT